MNEKAKISREFTGIESIARFREEDMIERVKRMENGGDDE